MDDEKTHRASQLRDLGESLRDLANSLAAERVRLEHRLGGPGGPGAPGALPALGPAPTALERQLHGQAGALLAGQAEARAELERLRGRLAELEEANRRAGELVGQAERQQALTAQRFATLAGLHASADREQVLQAIQEVVANLLGSEDVAVLWREPAQPATRLLLAHGPTAARLTPASWATGALARCLGAGQLLLGPDRPRGPAEAEPAACVPLRVEGRVAGAIALFRLLPHKPGLTPEDRELLELLGEHAALALQRALALAGEGGRYGP